MRGEGGGGGGGRKAQPHGTLDSYWSQEPPTTVVCRYVYARSRRPRRTPKLAIWLGQRCAATPHAQSTKGAPPKPAGAVAIVAHHSRIARCLLTSECSAAAPGPHSVRSSRHATVRRFTYGEYRWTLLVCATAGEGSEGRRERREVRNPTVGMQAKRVLK